MTTVTFCSEGSRIVGFEVKGHSGYAPQGEDIVCAAVTSAVRLTECAVNDVLGLGASVKVRESDASITMKIPGVNVGKGSDDTLFAMKSGRVKFERLGKDRKQVSIVEIAQ